MKYIHQEVPKPINRMYTLKRRRGRGNVLEGLTFFSLADISWLPQEEASRWVWKQMRKPNNTSWFYVIDCGWAEASRILLVPTTIISRKRWRKKAPPALLSRLPTQTSILQEPTASPPYSAWPVKVVIRNQVHLGWIFVQRLWGQYWYSEDCVKRSKK